VRLAITVHSPPQQGQHNTPLAGVSIAQSSVKTQPVFDCRAYRVPELIPVLVSQPAGHVSHKPGGRLLLLSTRHAVTHATLKRAATHRRQPRRGRNPPIFDLQGSSCVDDPPIFRHKPVLL